MADQGAGMNHTRTIKARVTEEDFALMHTLMDETGLSMSQIVRFLVRQARVTKYPVRPRRMLSRAERASDGHS